MYKSGTGDFFLLTFLKSGQPSYTLMIDCGCIRGSKALFAPLVSNLAEETGGEIDLLVVTHEHSDHMNGFTLAADQFAGIDFKKVWLAWTESDDPLAQ